MTEKCTLEELYPKLKPHEEKFITEFIKEKPSSAVHALDEMGYSAGQISKITDISKNKVKGLLLEDAETVNVPLGIFRLAVNKEGFPEVECMIQALKKE